MIGAKGRNAAVRAVLRIGMHGDVAVVEAHHHGFGQRSGPGDSEFDRCSAAIASSGDQDRDAGTMGIAILMRNIQNIGADDVGDVAQVFGHPRGAASLVDMADILALLRRRGRIVDVVDIEAQRLRQVIETVQLDLLGPGHHPDFAEKIAETSAKLRPNKR